MISLGLKTFMGVAENISTLKILHVNEIAQFTGGVERIMFDTALGLNLKQHVQGLLFLSGQADENLLTPFSAVLRNLTEVDNFAPDVVLVHKADSETVEYLSSHYRTIRYVHDHDIVCLRRHKYFPLSNQICDKPAGLSCITHACIFQRAPEGAIPIRLGSLKRQLNEISINRQLTGLVVGSEWMRQSLVVNGFDSEKVRVIPPVPASLGSHRTKIIDSTVPMILFVGQVIRGKGVDLLLRALAKLEGSWRAVIAGDGNFLHRAKRLRDNLNLTSKVEFTGQLAHEDLDDLYAQARCTVVPSRWPEPFGMVGVEAMSHSKAVIAFNVGGIPDWLEDGVTGRLVDPQDIVGLSIALQELIDRPDIAESFGQQGCERVLQRFNHQKYLDDIERFLEQASDPSYIDVCG